MRGPPISLGHVGTHEGHFGFRQAGYESRTHVGYREWVSRLNREGKILFIHISKLGYTEMEVALD
jgi:hypothetical protein